MTARGPGARRMVTPFRSPASVADARERHVWIVRFQGEDRLAAALRRAGVIPWEDKAELGLSVGSRGGQRQMPGGRRLGVTRPDRSARTRTPRAEPRCTDEVE